MKNLTTLFVKMNEQQWIQRAFPITEKQKDVIQSGMPKAMCVFVQNGTNHDYLIFFCEFAEIDYNGTSYYIRFSTKNDKALARYPGTGIFAEDHCKLVVESVFVMREDKLAELTYKSREMILPIMMNRHILMRVSGYTEHLAAKDKTIEAQQGELNLHRAALRKDYWLWEDDFQSNHIQSLNCPILMTPQQLRSLILEAARNPQLALAADE